MESGTRLGPYEILEPLGAGGMGEVYRARDTNLRREVAIKLLPEEMSRDPERLARLQREAQLLAALNHPRIAAIYSLESDGDSRFLVLELVEGETLAEHLARGPLTVEVALEIARQIAEALEVAHNKDIIHRDVKPANVKLTPEYEVKVLDFGLAKVFEDDTLTADQAPSDAPTSLASSRTGVVMGTVPYMSPEQARGQKVDTRTDVWSFGCVLYEMLTGSTPFRGETGSDVLAAILRGEPDWSALPATTPLIARLLLRRCLQKEPRDRLQAIGDARVELGEASAALPPELLAGTRVHPASTDRQRGVPAGVVAGVAALAALLAGVAVWSTARTPDLRPVTRAMIDLAPATRLADAEGRPFVISPDGTRLVYAGQNGEGSALYRHDLDQFGAVPIAGTDGATNPFFSPDGDWVGFFAPDGKLKKVLLSGGAPQTICDASAESYGASWGPDDTIVFASAQADLMVVSAGGGTPRRVASPDREAGELAYYWPQHLPGGKELLVTIWRAGGIDASSIAVLSLATGERQVLRDTATGARYAPTGHLVYSDPAGLVVAPFDLERLELTGTPVPILGNVRIAGNFGAAFFAFSDDGALVYLEGAEETGRLAWVDRDGVATAVTGQRRRYEAPRLSPDGTQALVWILERSGDMDAWMFDLARGTLTLVSFDGDNTMPLWMADGTQIVLASTRFGANALIRTRADGSGVAEVLRKVEHGQFPTSASSDGKLLAFYEVNPTTRRDIWVMSLDGGFEATPFLATPASERAAMFSPDGRWLAYVSDESGRDEVYVRPYPEVGQKVQISSGGGSEVVWARSGRELFYRQGDKMMSVPVETSPEFRAGAPELVFEEPLASTFRAFGYPRYDVSPDGDRFLMVTQEAERGSSQLSLVLNWFEELERITAEQ